MASCAAIGNRRSSGTDTAPVGRLPIGRRLPTVANLPHKKSSQRTKLAAARESSRRAKKLMDRSTSADKIRKIRIIETIY
jgi:hypothetical protein